MKCLNQRGMKSLNKVILKSNGYFFKVYRKKHMQKIMKLDLKYFMWDT
jgi:hypothetical protein